MPISDAENPDEMQYNLLTHMGQKVVVIGIGLELCQPARKWPLPDRRAQKNRHQEWGIDSVLGFA
jgi:hypothetical protein